MDEVLRAYAILGVRPGVSLAQLRGRYRALAKRWHPDLYSADPQGQAEAATRMQHINNAYRTLLRYLVVDDGKPSIAGAKAAQRPVRERLSREEIERIVTALGTDGPVDDLLSFLDSGRDFLKRVVAVVGLLGAVVVASLLLNVPPDSALLGGIIVVGYVFIVVFFLWRRIGRQ